VFSIISSVEITATVPRCKRPEAELVLVVGFAYGGMLLGITRELRSRRASSRLPLAACWLRWRREIREVVACMIEEQSCRFVLFCSGAGEPDEITRRTAASHGRNKRERGE
jgi:predicted alpha/beta hydrolase